MSATKTHEELRRMGGQFYTVYGECFCDTVSQSWRYIPEEDHFVERESRNRPRGESRGHVAHNWSLAQA